MQMVSVIVPCRNEIRHIQAFLDSLLAQQLGEGLDCEFLIADGMSTDGTRSLLADWQTRFKAFAILDNHAQTVSAGLNAAISQARGEIVLRMDVHTEYAPDYILQCVVTLRETGADNVGGPALALGDTYVQRAICLAYRSPFGCGGARFHDPNYEGAVDTVTYGCWYKSTLEKLGLFDETFVRNQDDELNLRLIRQGGRIWQTPRIRSWYRPRASLRGLSRQYSQYGYWKVRVMRKHRIPASWRHCVPGAFVAALLVFGISAPFALPSLWVLRILVASYLVATLAASAAACRKMENISLLPVMPLVFAAYHLSYGFGFLRGLWDAAISRSPSDAFTALVR
jgi:glycosyltransferase involved in cell wall biosynthesis